MLEDDKLRVYLRYRQSDLIGQALERRLYLTDPQRFAPAANYSSLPYCTGGNLTIQCAGAFHGK